MCCPCVFSTWIPRFGWDSIVYSPKRAHTNIFHIYSKPTYSIYSEMEEMENEKLNGKKTTVQPKYSMYIQHSTSDTIHNSHATWIVCSLCFAHLTSFRFCLKIRIFLHSVHNLFIYFIVFVVFLLGHSFHSLFALILPCIVFHSRFEHYRRLCQKCKDWKTK